jgi:arginase
MTIVHVPFHLDERLPSWLAEAPTVVPDLPDGSLPERVRAVNNAVAAEVRRTERPVVVSGDCSTAVGTLAGLQRAGLDPAVVWFDAHGDFNTPATTPSGYLGGMVLAVVTGRAGVPLVDGLTPIAEDRVVLVDARDLDPAEADALAGSAVRRTPVEALDAATLPPGPLYLHVDLDVVDAAEVPGLRYPVGGGPSASGVQAAMGRVLATGRVVAIGLALTFTADIWSRAGSGQIVASALIDEAVRSADGTV